MSTVRMNITIPEQLARKLDRLVSPRKKSKFIAESLEECIQRIEREELKAKLKEGYKFRRDEGLKIAEEFRKVDLEGWDEY
jgi:metal-responsive CopG/Arc/MetJ family transcriptional regulator